MKALVYKVDSIGPLSYGKISPDIKNNCRCLLLLIPLLPSLFSPSVSLSLPLSPSLPSLSVSLSLLHLQYL